MMKPRNMLKRLDANLKDTDPAFPIALMLLASAEVGPNYMKCAALAELKPKTAMRIAKKLRRTGIWVGHKISHSGWFDKETGGIAFWMDVACAQGLLVRDRR